MFKHEIEVSIRHLWVGLYWETWDETKKGWKPGDKWRRDYWITVIPLVAVHLIQTRKET